MLCLAWRGQKFKLTGFRVNRLNTVLIKANPGSISECLGYNYGDVLDCILHWFILRELRTSYLKECGLKGLTYSS